MCVHMPPSTAGSARGSSSEYPRWLPAQGEVSLKPKGRHHPALHIKKRNCFPSGISSPWVGLRHPDESSHNQLPRDSPSEAALTAPRDGPQLCLISLPSPGHHVLGTILSTCGF